jgi:hypothetical protein
VPGQPTSDVQAVARILYPGDVLEVIEREIRGHDILDLRGADEIARGFVDLADQDGLAVILRLQSGFQCPVEDHRPVRVGDGQGLLGKGITKLHASLEQDERLIE